MPYSELANWDGSLFDSPGAPNSSSRQSEPDITAGRCASERRDVAKGAAGRGECHDGGSTFERNVRDSVSKAMAGRTQRRVKSSPRRGDKGDMLDQIVVTSRKSSNLEVKSDAPVVEEDIISSTRGKAGPFSAAGKNNSRPKVQRTYAGPRRIKGVSYSSGLKKGLTSRPLFDGSLASALIPYPEDDAISDQDSSVDLLLLTETSSRTRAPKDDSNAVPSDSSSRPRPINETSQSALTVPQRKSLTSFPSRNSFQASLSNIINNKRHQTLEKVERDEKPRSKPPSIKPQPTPVFDQKASANHNKFDCVLITSRPFRVPRELYKSLEEHAAAEEEGRLANQENRKEKGQKTYGRRQPIARSSKPRPKPAITEAIYVVSSSEGSIAGPSDLGIATHTHVLDDEPKSDLNDAAIRVDSSSDDGFVRSAPAPRKKNPRPKLNSRPSPSKQTGQMKRVEVVLASESSLEPEADVPVTLLAQKNSAKSPLSLSPDLPQTPSTVAPERTPEQIRAEVAVDRIAEPNLEEVGDGRSMEGATKAIVVSSSPHENSLVAPSTSQREISTATSILPEIVVKAKAPAENVHNHAMQQRSSTLCLSGTSSRLNSVAPSSRSVTLAVQDEPSDPTAHASAGEVKVKMGTGKGNVKNAEVVKGRTTQRHLDEESDSDEEDDVCHHCRTRNVYAKMKCTNVKASKVCPLSFCHRCIVVFFPTVNFDPFSGTFVCPACSRTCRCKGCCNKLGIPDHPRPRGLKWNKLGVTLLLSPQETRRQERQAAAEAARMSHPLQKTDRKQAVVSRWSRGASASKAKGAADIGSEAEDWIRQQGTALRKIGKAPARVFVGAWLDAWGSPPATLHTMEGADVDTPAATGMGKGKGKAVDPQGRLFVGDAQALHRSFLRAEDVSLFTELAPKKRPLKRRKPATVNAGCDSIYVTSEAPKKKKRRVEKLNSIPEFTLNHQDSTFSSAASSLQRPAPDDFFNPDIEPSALNGDAHTHLRYHVTHDPMLSVVDPAFSSDALGDDMYGSDSECMDAKVGMKPFSGPGFSYQETYDSYAAALGVAAGLEHYDSAFSYGYGYSEIVHPAPPRNDKVDMQVSHTAAVNDAMMPAKDSNADTKEDDDFTHLIDPALFSEENAVKEVAEQDPMQFFTANACASAPMSVPTIYGVPSSTGLSLQDLERTMRTSLTVLSTQSPS